MSLSNRIRWPTSPRCTGGGRQRHQTWMHSQRAEKEKLAREKYAVLLADFINNAALPLVAQLEAVDDGGVSWKHIFGTRRRTTL